MSAQINTSLILFECSGYVLEEQVNLNINDFNESSPETTADSCPYVSIPDCLTLLPLSGNSVMLSWSPSAIKRIDENISHSLLGKNIFVNLNSC